VVVVVVVVVVVSAVVCGAGGDRNNKCSFDHKNELIVFNKKRNFFWMAK
jgi:hypothetical protein